MRRSVLFYFIALIASGCSPLTMATGEKPGPKLHYLGTEFPPPDSIAIYFDRFDAGDKYKVIGYLTSDPSHHEADVIQKKMVAEGRELGAEGIIFTHFEVYKDFEEATQIVVEAQLIRYK